MSQFFAVVGAHVPFPPRHYGEVDDDWTSLVHPIVLKKNEKLCAKSIRTTSGIRECSLVMVCVGVWLGKTFTRYVNTTRFKYEIN